MANAQSAMLIAAISRYQEAAMQEPRDRALLGFPARPFRNFLIGQLDDGTYQKIVEQLRGRA
jgi:hypothetical protein